MYVWGRLARMVATSAGRGPYVFGDQGRLHFRCLPSDIDTNGHLNNARYMMLADVGRIDLFLRSGLLRLARAQRWAPMLGGLQVAFVREIRLWKRIELISSIETWTGTQMLGQHQFVLEDGRVAALIMTSGGLYDLPNRVFLDMATVMQRLGMRSAPRPPTDEESAFMASHLAIRAVAKNSVRQQEECS